MDKLVLYNTLSRKKEVFTPIKPPFVGLYVCGPTVYGNAHLGHARSAMSFDVVFRYMRYLGYKVRYVRNITDVGHLVGDLDHGESKIEKKARLEQLEPMEVAQFYLNSYIEDMTALNILRPSIEPRATGHIPEQIEMVEEILKNGYAYEVNGSVYFDVPKYDQDFGYGALSGRDLENIKAASRDNLEGTGEKRHSADFALWKKAEPSHLMRWDSPWSVGFPGWHLECTVMSTKYLGTKYDIHGGGMDLVFPHHEAEIAQSNACNCHAPKELQGEANFWLHNNMITLNGQKMGKSLGNAIDLKQFFSGEHDLLEKAYSPMNIRFFMLQAHYRSTLDFSNEALQASERGFKRICEGISRLEEISTKDRAVAVNTAFEENLISFMPDVRHQMNDDFHTAKTIARIFEALPVINQLHAQKNGPLAVKAETLTQFKQDFHTLFFDILGLKLEEESGNAGNELVDQLMGLITELRADARKEKNWAVSDKIRDGLGSLDIQLKDSADGTTWEIG